MENKNSIALVLRFVLLLALAGVLTLVSLIGPNFARTILAVLGAILTPLFLFILAELKNKEDGNRKSS